MRVRLNPSLRVQAYRVAMTGGPSPFGIDEEDLPLAAAALLRHAQVLDFDGLHVHPGGQYTSVGGFGTAVAATLDLTERLHREHGLVARRVNFGGGFGVLGDGQEFDVEAAGKRLDAMLTRYRAATGQALEAVLELGRWLMAPAGLYVAPVVSEKCSRGTHFTVLDGGLNHHLSATGLLGPRLPLINLSRRGAPPVTRTVVGPLCTPLSFSPLHFLGHALPAEVLIAGDRDEPRPPGAPPRSPAAS